MHPPLKSYYHLNPSFADNEFIEGIQGYYKIIVVMVMFITLGFKAPTQDLIQRTLDGSLEKTSLKSGTPLFSPFSIDKSFKSSTYKEYTDEAIYMSIDIEKLGRLLKTNQVIYVLSIPVSIDQAFNLILEEVEVLTPGYYTETASGQIIYPDVDKIKFLRGTIENDSTSIVSISIVDHQLRGVISDKDGNYNLGMLTDHKNVYTLYNDKTLKVERSYSCEVDDMLQFSSIDQDIVKPKATKNNIDPCVPIYVEADYETYLDNGSSLAQVESYVMSLIAEVAMIYDINTGNQADPKSINISLAKTFVWDQVDPYRSINSSGDILDLFGSRLYNNQSDPGDGKLSHFISTRNLYSGVAWVDVLCSDFSEYCLYTCTNGNSGYAPCGLNINGCSQVSPVQSTYPGPAAVSTGLGSISSFPNYSWTVEVFAHEMGHNMGSPHTHNCSWDGGAIDGCGPAAGYSEGCNAALPGQGEGTIMSYCHLVNGVGISLSNGFGMQPGTLIHDRYINGNCGLSCSGPNIDGCMDVLAHNFNPAATIDDGSCETCDDGEWNGDEIGVDCGGALCVPCQGCTDINAHNYDSIATVDDGSCETCDDGEWNGDEIGVDCGGALCVPCQGCTDSDSHNYDPIATVDDGSCETCDDGMLNGDEIGIDCGGTLCFPCQGCTDLNAHNYDSIATVDDGSCETCDDGILNGDEEYIDCGGSRCVPCITGCDTDADAYNYVINADIEEACETCFDGILNGDEQAIDCGGSYPGCPECITGCMEVFASNYEPNADIAGTCTYDCDASATSMIDDSNKNKVIISNANTLTTEMLSDIEVDTSMPLFWRAKQTIELNNGFSIMAGTELTIDPGDCEIQN